MKKKISNLPFKGTPEQEEKLKAVIEECKGQADMVIHVLQEAQNIYGYLPFEVQVMIADGMDLPLEKVYGVSTFYSQFALSPKGKYSISVCMGTACYVKGAKDILDKVCEKLVRTNAPKTASSPLMPLDASVPAVWPPSLP